MLTTAVKTGAYALAAKEIADSVSGWRLQKEAGQKRQRNRNLLLGLAIGTAVGATAGVFLAPRSGRENREEFLCRLGSAMETLTKKVSEMGKTGASGQASGGTGEKDTTS